MYAENNSILSIADRSRLTRLLTCPLSGLDIRECNIVLLDGGPVNVGLITGHIDTLRIDMLDWGDWGGSSDSQSQSEGYEVLHDMLVNWVADDRLGRLHASFIECSARRRVSGYMLHRPVFSARLKACATTRIGKTVRRTPLYSEAIV
jgi:hypothetical protein